MKLPTFETELAYAVEAFEDENDRKPTPEELREIEGEVAWKICLMEEAYAEWVPGKHYR
jgi:hypothetical protein